MLQSRVIIQINQSPGSPQKLATGPTETAIHNPPSPALACYYPLPRPNHLALGSSALSCGVIRNRVLPFIHSNFNALCPPTQKVFTFDASVCAYASPSPDTYLSCILIAWHPPTCLHPLNVNSPSFSCRKQPKYPLPSGTLFCTLYSSSAILSPFRLLLRHLPFILYYSASWADPLSAIC